MASLARKVAALQSRLSTDSQHTESSTWAPHLCLSPKSKASMPSTSSFSDFSLCLGDEVSTMYDAADAADTSQSLSALPCVRNPPSDEVYKYSSFADGGHSSPIAYMRTAFTHSAPGQRVLAHTLSMPLPVPAEHGSDIASSAPVRIPTAHESRSEELSSDNTSDALAARAPRPRRSLLEIMTTPSPVQDCKTTLDYYEFADVMRSY